MTREEFDEKLLDTFSVSEIAIINTNIFYNEDHKEYFNKFHSREYEWCYDYLVEHRKLLSLSHTPSKYKDYAIKLIENAKVLYRHEASMKEDNKQKLSTISK